MSGPADEAPGERAASEPRTGLPSEARTSRPPEPPPLHGDLTQRVAVDASALAWVPSPSPGVWRKRLHRTGPAESGQVTSLVRFDPGAHFPAHDHPDGEEILVLEGVFSDEQGDWPAGTWLLNPQGFRHAPFSREGCLLFVKLRQAPGPRQHAARQTQGAAWRPDGRDGIEVLPLHAPATQPDVTRLERWRAGTAPGRVTYARGAELFVLAGDLADEHGTYPAGSWLRLPAGSAHTPRSEAGCTLYLKLGGLGLIRS